jgi:death-on-curing protein
MELRHLDRTDVVRIYDHLVEEFSYTDDPIAPAGVRDNNLLESAISRQQVGLGEKFKYPKAVSNAVTLAYGICSNHPFFNGNKRTALVSLLAHLDRNKVSLWGLSQDQLYGFMLSVAKHTVADFVGVPRRPNDNAQDVEVTAMATYIGSHTFPVVRGDQKLTYRELRRLLSKYGYGFGDPKRSFIPLVRLADSGPIKIDSIIYPGEGREAGVDVVKRVREKCRLREEDGVDSEAFYSEYIPLDSFIQKYRVVLRRLGKT